MKRMNAQRKRPPHSKKGLKKPRRFFRTIKSQKKFDFRIESPYNSSQFLIENSSSPFFEDEEDDIGVDYTCNPLITIKETEELYEEDSMSLMKFPSATTRNESFNAEKEINVEEHDLFWKKRNWKGC